MPETDIELLKAAAAEAARIATSYWSGKNEVWEKSPDNPVSEADLAVDEFLNDALRGARPEYGWLSEETADTRDRLNKRSVFVVDPIDGTRAFIAGRRTWAISLAVVTDGKPTAGVVYLPLREKFYAANKGEGATLNDRPIRVSTTTKLETAHVVGNKATMDPKNWKTVPKIAEREYRPSLAYRMCLVAEGRCDAMISFRDSWEWDVAGGSIIATEAGAILTDRDGLPPVFNSEPAALPGVIVAPLSMHTALMAHRPTRP